MSDIGLTGHAPFSSICTCASGGHAELGTLPRVRGTTRTSVLPESSLVLGRTCGNVSQLVTKRGHISSVDCGRDLGDGEKHVMTIGKMSTWLTLESGRSVHWPAYTHVPRGHPHPTPPLHP